jgi:hypothetical protein
MDAPVLHDTAREMLDLHGISQMAPKRAHLTKTAHEKAR